MIRLLTQGQVRPEFGQIETRDGVDPEHPFSSSGISSG
jgi:hypothetical protein